jgi:hypothetical protein
MPKLSGRNGALYANITSSGTAEPIAYLNNWSVDFSTDKIDVTSFGDVTKTYVAGLPDFKGSYAGFYDNATAQLYTAATDGAARKFYLYPDRTASGQYWFGTAFFDFSIADAVDGAVQISGGFNAATASAKVG